MKPENLPAMTRLIVREVCIGLTDEDISLQHPEFTPMQIHRMRSGATFKKAVREMQAQIDEELIGQLAEDPVRKYMASKGLKMAQRLVSLAEDDDGQTPHAVQAKAADSILNRAGYGGKAEDAKIPVLMVSPEKLAAILNPKKMALDSVPDMVDGHNGGLADLKMETVDNTERV
jgi:hypothetical protein